MSAQAAAEEVAMYIRDSITSGQLLAGDRIDLDWIASRLEVSRTPVREALVRLESEGLLESLPSRATIVRRISMRRVEELFAARIPIEGTLAMIGAARITDAELDALGRLLEGILAENDLDRDLALIDLHTRLLLTIYEAAGSEQLFRIAQPLVIQGSTLARHFSYANRGDLKRSGHDPWIEMVAACEARDGLACQQILRSHLVTAAAAILSLERTADELEYLPAVLTPAEKRTYRTLFSSTHRRARRVVGRPDRVRADR